MSGHPEGMYRETNTGEIGQIMLELWKKILVRIFVYVLLNGALVYVGIRLMEVMRTSDISEDFFEISRAAAFGFSIIFLGLSFRFIVSDSYSALQDARGNGNR